MQTSIRTSRDPRALCRDFLPSSLFVVLAIALALGWAVIPTVAPSLWSLIEPHRGYIIAWYVGIISAYFLPMWKPKGSA